MDQVYDIVTLIGQILDRRLCRVANGVKGVALCHDDGCQLVKVTRFVSLDRISNALLYEICLTVSISGLVTTQRFIPSVLPTDLTVCETMQTPMQRALQ